MSKVVSICLPHPSRVLRPNRPVHWSVRARAVKRARVAARLRMLMALGELPGAERSEFAPGWYRLVWFYKGTRPDADNCLAACKAYLDGCCDALKVDDRDLECAGIRRKHDMKRAGQVELCFSEDF